MSKSTKTTRIAVSPSTLSQVSEIQNGTVGAGYGLAFPDGKLNKDDVLNILIEIARRDDESLPELGKRILKTYQEQS